jgi:hypothetical protein
MAICVLVLNPNQVLDGIEQTSKCHLHLGMYKYTLTIASKPLTVFVLPR